MLETWVLNTQINKAFLTRAVSEMGTCLGNYQVAKRLLFLKRLTRANVIYIFQTVNVRVQHGGDHCIQHGSNEEGKHSAIAVP